MVFTLSAMSYVNGSLPTSNYICNNVICAMFFSTKVSNDFVVIITDLNLFISGWIHETKHFELYKLRGRFRIPSNFVK